MTYHEFKLPPDVEFEIAVGVTPEHGEDGVRRLEISGSDGIDLELTLDPLGRSVNLITSVGGRELATIFREGATALRLSENAPEIVIAFSTDDTTGRLEVSLTPEPRVSETALLA